MKMLCNIVTLVKSQDVIYQLMSTSHLIQTGMNIAILEKYVEAEFVIKAEHFWRVFAFLCNSLPR